jgi:hypothetical protein
MELAFKRAIQFIEMFASDGLRLREKAGSLPSNESAGKLCAVTKLDSGNPSQREPREYRRPPGSGSF